MEQVYASKIQFGLLSSETLRKISVLRVDTNDLYEKGVPKAGGLCDLRLGTTDRQFKCQTCHGDILTCPGHFGHIDLIVPVYHIGFMKTVIKVLQCVCFECSRVLYQQPCQLKRDRFKFLYDKCKKSECPHCETKQPKYSFDAYKIYMDSDDNKVLVTAKQALYILKRITDEDATYLGFDPVHGHPKSMILSIVPVSPPQVRPSIVMDTSLRSQDDLTHKLSEIIRANANVAKHMEGNGSEQTIFEFMNLLQFHVNTLIDNEIPGQPQATQRTGRPIKAISQRLKAKGGRIRGNLMGKRVNFSARSVITAEPNIDLDELGVPIEIASNMTVPETVTSFNKHILEGYIAHGTSITDVNQVGAKYVIRADGTKCDLRFKGKDFTLQEGDVVERTMKTGDVVVFNRQPTLHKMSMMAHKVVVMEHKTFRLNLSATTPYNADFDGDEMNLHLPQSLAATAELKELMAVSNNIVSAQANKPVIGIVQDSLLAAWMMTGKDIFFTWEQVANIVWNGKSRVHSRQVPHPAIRKPTMLWTGKQVFAMLLPPTFHFRRKSSWYAEDNVPAFSYDDGEVIVRHGEIMCGQLCKKSLGASEGGVIHRLWLEYSPEMAKNFISSLQFLVNYFIQNRGFSIGAEDTFIDQETKMRVRQSIDDNILQVKQILHVSQHNENKALFEKKINQILNNAMAQSGKFVQDKMTTKNNIHAAVTAGSKGSAINLSQIMACVGQQNVNGQRIKEGYTDRPLPHFEKHDQSPEARGFVKHSYLEGLEAHEFFYHAMGGREGVIDTAVKSVTGDTPIIILEDGVSKYVHIGDWIDAHLARAPEEVQHFEARRMELLLLDASTVYIPTTDENGKVTWGEVTHVTRHDPGTELYEIKTEGGKRVIVTESKSLLVWNETLGAFKETLTPDIKVGHFVPVTATLCAPPTVVDEVGMFTLDRENGVSVGTYLARDETAHVPDVAFIAPEEFIVGILDAYFRGSTDVQSTSVRLAEGISMLCTRIGVFATTRNSRVTIQARWINTFFEKIRLGSGNPSGTSFTQHHDVVLDPIVEINIIDATKYPKVYDLTIPSTLNFGLANGLQVRDTSNTGYIQRRLVKAMEDLMVEHDTSVRNSSNEIVQFVYGDDGYDGSMLITQNMYDGDPSPYACDEEREALVRRTSFKSVKSPLLIDIMFDKYKSFSKTTLTHTYVYKRVQELINKIRPTSMVVRDQLVTGLSSKRVIDEYNISAENFDVLLEDLYFQHNRACVCKGDAIGIVAAQSMGEVVTQLCLNTFHSAGISAKNVTLGVPRFTELINVSKNIKSPMMTLPLKDEYSSYENIDFIAQHLEYVNIGLLITRKYMSHERLPFTQKYLDLPFDVPEYYEKSIVFHFNTSALKRSGKTLYDIYTRIYKNYEDTLLPVYNHENDEPMMEILIMNDEDVDMDDRYVFVLMNKIMSKMTLDGDIELKKTFVRRDEDTRGWIIETDGLNLEYIFSLEYFKHDMCVTNHVVYVYEHFGVEAARNVLLQEIKNVIEFDGSYVNRRHFYILVDTMTHKGDIMPITRHGINKANTGPLMKCSFEETMDILTDAGIFSERDDLNGVTENIIMGKLAPIGSGSCDVMFNPPEGYDMDTIDEEEGFVPASPNSSHGQYTDGYFGDDSTDAGTDTWFDDAGTETTETYFPIISN